MKRRTQLAILFFAILVVVVAVMMGGSDSSVKEETPSLTADTSGLDKVVPVKCEIIREQMFEEIVTASGVIEAWHRAFISSETGGRVVKWNADVGDKLPKGGTVVQLDDQIAAASLKQAEAALNLSRVAETKLGNDLRKLRNMHKQGDISDTQLEEAELNYESSRSNLMSAEAAAELATRAHDETNVRMPFAGHVAFRLVDTGQMLAPGVPVAEVVQADPVRLSVGFSEQGIVRIRKGQKAVVKVFGHGAREFVGKVHAVGVAADAMTRQYPVEMRIPNGEMELKPGMAATVEIAVAAHEGALSIPLESVKDDGDVVTYFVVEDGKAVRRTVKTAAVRGDRMMVRSGISAGDSLVVVGQDGLRQGQRVKVAAE